MSDVLVRPLRLLPAPDPNPPYDAYDAPWTRATREAAGQGVLPLRFESSLGPTAERRPEDPGADVADRARVLSRAVADALSGIRSPEQLRYGFSGNAHRRLVLAIRLAEGRRYVVAATHVRHVDASTVEVAATLHGSAHAHLMALRLEVRHERWVCTALDTGFLPRQR